MADRVVLALAIVVGLALTVALVERRAHAETATFNLASYRVLESERQRLQRLVLQYETDVAQLTLQRDTEQATAHTAGQQVEACLRDAHR